MDDSGDPRFDCRWTAFMANVGGTLDPSDRSPAYVQWMHSERSMFLAERHLPPDTFVDDYDLTLNIAGEYGLPLPPPPDVRYGW